MNTLGLIAQNKVMLGIMDTIKTEYFSGHTLCLYRCMVTCCMLLHQYFRSNLNKNMVLSVIKDY